ncbi:hypothetical protein CK934_05020 [Chitinophaga sp. MD30]|nr:hypothetical protein CK934_05020 [Chitinophaga sp. MD30]
MIFFPLNESITVKLSIVQAGIPTAQQLNTQSYELISQGNDQIGKNYLPLEMAQMPLFTHVTKMNPNTIQ